MAENDHVKALQEVQSKLNELSRRMDGFESRLQDMQAQLRPTAEPAKPPPLPADYVRGEDAQAAAKAFDAAADWTPVAWPPPPAIPAEQNVPLPSRSVSDIVSPPTAVDEIGRLIGATAEEAAKPSAAASATAPAGRTLSIEQVIGARWMLIAGVVALIAAGGYFFKLAYDKGWITPMHRLVMGGVFGLVLIAGGCWMLRKKLNAFAGAMMGVGIVWMYQSIYVASPSGLWQGLHAVSTPTSFALMCAVTILGMALAAATKMQLTAVISLAGAIATPMLLSTGENRFVTLMVYLLAVNVGFAALGLRKRWQVLAPLAMAGTAILFGLWFERHYQAAAYAQTIAFAWAFAILYAATGIWAQRSSRHDPRLCAAMVFAPAILLAWLLIVANPPGQHHPFALQLLVLAAAVFMYSLVNQLKMASVLSLTASCAMMTGQFIASNQDAPRLWCCLYSWLLLALPCVALARPASRRWDRTNIALWAIAGLFHLFNVTMLINSDRHHLVLTQVMLFDALVLVIAQWRRWRWIRMELLLLTAICVVAAVELPRPQLSVWPALSWTWGFFALFMADIVRRAFWQSNHRQIVLECILSLLASAGMFALTYTIMSAAYPYWTGLYAVVISAVLAGVVYVLHRWPKDKTLASCILVQALLLLALAAPIQYDHTAVTIAWMLQALAGMIVARLLKKPFHSLLWLFSPLTVGAALLHWFIDVQEDGWLGGILFSPLGVNITIGLAVGVAISLTILAIVWVLRLNQPIRSEDEDRSLAAVLTIVASMLFVIEVIYLLPPLSQAYWLLAWTALLAGAAVRARSGYLSILATVILALTILKWLFVDSVGSWRDQAFAAMPVAANWHGLAGLLLAVAAIAWAKVLASRKILQPAALVDALGLLGPVVLVWAGSVEIVRFFQASAQTWSGDATQATHTALSIWWGLSATAALAVGFIIRKAPLRYLAIAIFAVTIGKIFWADLSKVEMPYRVLSLLGLGMLLLSGSWLYHRAAASKEKDHPQDEIPGQG